MEVTAITVGLITLILGIGVLVAGVSGDMDSPGFFFAGLIISIASLCLIGTAVDSLTTIL